MPATQKHLIFAILAPQKALSGRLTGKTALCLLRTAPFRFRREESQFPPSGPRKSRATLRLVGRQTPLSFGRRQIDRDTLAVGKFISAISQRRFDALATFLHGVVRQTYNIEIRHPRRTYVHLYLDEVGVNSVHRSAERLEEHRNRADPGSARGGREQQALRAA
jgi:hypothetical protein